MSKYSIEEARQLLTAAGVFFGAYFPEDDKVLDQSLNLNDVFGWGGSDTEYVSDEELPRVAELFFRYGFPGIEYWVAEEKRGGLVPEFYDVQREIQFVKAEENIRKEIPQHSKRAYTKKQYTIG
jgi:hypothetical protein